MQSPERLSGKDLPLSSPKLFRLQTQERPLESIKGSCKSLPRLTVSQHLLSPPCLVEQCRYGQDSGERRLSPWETPGVKKEKKNPRSCNQSPHHPNTRGNLDNRKYVFLQNTNLAYKAVGLLDMHMQRAHHPGLQLLD